MRRSRTDDVDLQSDDGDPVAAASRRQIVVATLQWGLVQTFLLQTAAGVLAGYDAWIGGVPPAWPSSLRFAALPAFLVGAYGGYRWLDAGPGAATSDAHRRRVRFLGAFLVGWALAVVPALVWGVVVGEPLGTPAGALLPGLSGLAALAAAWLFGYRRGADGPAWYRRRRGHVLGAVAGCLTGIAVCVLLVATLGPTLDGPGRTSTPAHVTPLVGVAIATLGGVAVGTRVPDRVREYLTLLVASTLALSVAVGVGAVFLAVSGLGESLGGLAGSVGATLAFVVPFASALVASAVAAFWAETDVVARVVG